MSEHGLYRTPEEREQEGTLVISSLEKAWEKISTPEHWCQRAAALDEEGRTTSLDEASVFCALGALWALHLPESDENLVWTFMRSSAYGLYRESVLDVNDRGERYEAYKKVEKMYSKAKELAHQWTEEGIWPSSFWWEKKEGHDNS